MYILWNGDWVLKIKHKPKNTITNHQYKTIQNNKKQYTIQ